MTTPRDASHVDNPFAMMKALRRTENSDSGSSSNGDNQSDNSALVSIGNTSFGFNFDGESNSRMETLGNSSDSDGGNGPLRSSVPAVSVSSSNSNVSGPDTAKSSVLDSPHGSDRSSEGVGRSSIASNSSTNNGAAAEESAERLKLIASSCMNQNHSRKEVILDPSRKRKQMGGSENSSGGYNSDEEDDDNSGDQDTQSKSRTDSRGVDSMEGGGKRKKMDGKKRQERNAREKERSFRISKQINELRDLLSSGGVLLPKGTKSSVLTEAANYIRLLQQHQYRSEIERHQLIQQMHLIGSGAHGPQAANAVKHAAAQNGVWSLGNFGGMPPKSAMAYQSPQIATPDSTDSDATVPSTVSVEDYRFIFNSCGVGMAVASMGGAFIDCNELFGRLSEYTKQELCSLTIFNLTARCDLQNAFDLISHMISPPMDGMHDTSKQVVLRGTMKNRHDLGLSVSLVKGENGVAKCFCVTLIKNPTSPFDTEPPVPVSFESVPHSSFACPTGAFQAPCVAGSSGKLIATTPAFTSG